ncbi:MAG: flavodoxin domain-containing protein [Propionibacteriaceae bacterium]|jgi:menaquinone-dependent protoporphyrinogen oxidase|nr:flavodoxin domain-containing protein [Propionibacteriaceae bacterium]
MTTAVVFASKHGTTAQVADQIAEALDGATLIDLGVNPSPELGSFDAIVVGGPVYAGQPMKALKSFLAAHANTLLAKPLALFVCGMEPDPAKRDAEIAATYGEPLSSHAVGVWFAGGAFRFDKLGFLEKAIVKRIAHVTESTTIRYDDVPAQIAAALKGAQ